MPLVTPTTIKEKYDVIVVGSGAAGGQTAYTLTMEGAKVLMLEAGRDYVPETETPMFQTPDQAPLRGADTSDKPMGFFDATVNGGWKIEGEPYTNALEKPARDEDFTWWRPRMLGGRTNHWARVSLRNGPYDFKPRSRDGLGFDWPISYEELAPYYDKAEMLIGVYGTNEGLENTPDSSPGCLLPPPKARISELLIQKFATQQRVPVIPCHRAVLSVRQDAVNLPARLHPNNPFAQKLTREAMESRAACFWATECQRGCAIRANYQSTTVHLPPAMASGNLDLLPNAMVRKVTLGKDGRARGVTFVDKTTGQEFHASAKAVVLAAGTCETIRLLLNSKSAQFPHGLANSSGLVGKYLMDTVGCYVGGQVPLLEDMPPHHEHGASGGHLYSPWWLYKEQRAGKLDFPRGYHIELVGGKTMPDLGTLAGKEWITGGSYGPKFKSDARRLYGSFVGFAGRGEMVPNDKCYCELDPMVTDQWGIPALRFHWKFSEYELKQVTHMQQTFAQIIGAMGGKVHPHDPDPRKGIDRGGAVIHEVGGAMMGNDPAHSVANKWGQTHDVPNLFLNDGATFCSNADKNPTLTIIAMAWRASDHLLEEMRKGNI